MAWLVGLTLIGLTAASVYQDPHHQWRRWPIIGAMAISLVLGVVGLWGDALAYWEAKCRGGGRGKHHWHQFLGIMAVIVLGAAGATTLGLGMRDDLGP